VFTDVSIQCSAFTFKVKPWKPVPSKRRQTPSDTASRPRKPEAPTQLQYASRLAEFGFIIGKCLLRGRKWTFHIFQINFVLQRANKKLRKLEC